LSEQIRSALDAQDSPVVLLARVGQDLSRYGLHYSHMAYALRDDAASDPAQRWTVVHLLNECGRPRANLYSEGLGWFFLDKPFRYEALLVFPSAEVAARLQPWLLGERAQALQAPRYNMLAYPFNAASQNSNGWALELYAAATAPEAAVLNHADAVAWLKREGFHPDVIRLDTLTRLGADFTRFNINFNDHPVNERVAGRIATTTVEAALRFMARHDPAMRQQRIELEKPSDA
jgi:hypothetical protein